MDKDEIKHMKGLEGNFWKAEKDETWKKAFDKYNELHPHRSLSMGCRPCYKKILAFWEEQL